MKKGWLILLIVFIVGLLEGGILWAYKNHVAEEKRDYLEDFYEDRDEEMNNNPNWNNSKDNYISRDEALQKVLNSLNINKKDIYDIDIELEYMAKYNKQVYEVSFDYNYYEYEFFVNASTGEILHSYMSRD